MRLKFVLVILFLLEALGQSVSAQQKPQRVALVIGNDSYQKVAALANARSDARSIAAALQKAGFEIGRAHV